MGVLKLNDGTVLCYFYQEGMCHHQTATECQRNNGKHKHLCGYRKQGGICGDKHPRKNHDPAKHGQ